MWLLAAIVVVSAVRGDYSYWREESPQFFNFYELEHVDRQPAFRYCHGAVSDDARGRMVVTHGYFYDHRLHVPTWLADTWAFHFTSRTWARIHDGTGEAPSLRYGHLTVLTGNTMILHGGDGPSKTDPTGPSSTSDEMWAFNLRTHTWTATAALGPSPPARSLHAGAILESHGRKQLLIHGGLGKSDTWIFDLTDHAWREIPSRDGPGTRHGAVAVAFGDSVFLHGGGTVNPVVLFDDLWRFRVGSGWAKMRASPVQPSGRNYHAASLLVRDTPMMVMFGGANCTGACICFNDLWTLNLVTMQWTQVHTLSDIPTRYHHSLVVHHEDAYTFGGESYTPRYMYHNSVTSITVANQSHWIAFFVLFVATMILASMLWCAWTSRRGRRKTYEDHIQ
eukprot:m.44695 g.44695  ORF g.44695 m.44695 type:complete len:393 (-) comp5838_c0_seq2:1413-2591(-)